MYKLTNSTSVVRADGAFIPADTGNTDYQKYLTWLSEGNTPLPADIPDPKLAIQSQIQALESQQLMPRATREFMLLFMQQSFTPEQLALNQGYQSVKAFDDTITALRTELSALTSGAVV